MEISNSRMLHLVHGKCCVCESDDTEQVGSGKDYEYDTSADTFLAMRCKICRLVYLNPHPAITEFEKIYPPNYHAFNFSKKQYGPVYKIRSWLEAKRLLRFCNDLADEAKIIDVGCGDGFHLNLLRQYGTKSWTLEGIDLDKRAVEMAEKSGLKLHLGTPESVQLPENTYDMAIMIQTIEHVEKPDSVLRAIQRILKPGGKLMIVTDNTDSLDFRFFKRSYWGGYHFPRHLNLFNRNSITRLANKTGFVLENLGTQVSPVNWIYTIHNWLVDKKAPAWLIKQFTLKSMASLSVFTALDMILQKAGKGALLRVILRKPLI